MRTVFPFLLALIAAAPLLFVDSLLSYGVLGAFAALFVLVIAYDGLASDFLQLKRHIALVAAFWSVPGIWIGLQVIPWPWTTLQHPVWVSAATALGHPVTGPITMDIGATLATLSCYIFAVTLALATLAFALDRTRAQRILFALLVACGGASLVLLVLDPVAADSRASLETIAALGIVVGSASLTCIIERAQTRSRPHTPVRGALTRDYFPALVGSTVILALCMLTLLTSRPLLLIAAATTGWILFIGLMLIRRTDLGYWAVCMLGGALVTAVLATAYWGKFGNLDITLRFATHVPPDVLTLNERILNDTSNLGNGAGTFNALVPIHRDFDGELAPRPGPATAATSISSALGRPALWLLIALALAWAARLAGGALNRGRDAFYPAAGAAGLIVLIVYGFITNGLFTPASVIVIAALLGLAQAQSVGRQSA